MAHSEIDDELWQEFHDAVNMTSRELRDWLATDAAGPDGEEELDQVGSDRSRAVLEILGKRRTDLTDDDARVMRSVVQQVRDLRGDDRDPEAGDAAWRRRLMRVGHDPLKPAP
jgi:hypothetical protein